MNSTNQTVNDISNAIIDTTINTEYYPFLILTIGLPIYSYIKKDHILLSFSLIISLIATIISFNSDANIIFSLIHMLITGITIIGLLEK